MNIAAVLPNPIFLECWTPGTSHSWSTTAKVTALEIASLLTDPICKVREHYYSFYMLNETCKTTARKVAQCAFLTLGIVVCILLTPVTAPAGALIRGAVATLSSKPYIYLNRGGEGKVLPHDKKISLLSYNTCHIGAGYSLTDGGVTISSDRARMIANVEKIKQLQPDVICLFEISDIRDANFIASELPDYPFVIPVAGLRAIGPSSMMFVASKYELVDITFTPFIKGTELTGWSRFSEKGFLSFDVKSRGLNQPFAKIVSTHLQHSEEPANPTNQDTLSRVLEMDRISKKIRSEVEGNKTVILTGDLNQQEHPLQICLCSYGLGNLKSDLNIKSKPTWGGDEWSAKFSGKKASPPLVLDHTLVSGKNTAITTKITETNFSGKEFRPQALSDHYLLQSTITVI
jgi:hypothetical protein